MAGVQERQTTKEEHEEEHRRPWTLRLIPSLLLDLWIGGASRCMRGPGHQVSRSPSLQC